MKKLREERTGEKGKGEEMGKINEERGKEEVIIFNQMLSGANLYLHTQIYDAHWQNHSQEDGRGYADHNDGAEDTEHCHDERSEGPWDGLINDIHILGEPV